MSATNIVTLAELKTHLGIPAADTGDDDALTALIQGIESRFETHCNRVWKRETVTEKHDPGTRIIAVRRPPIDPDEDLGLTIATLDYIENTDFIVLNTIGQIQRIDGMPFTGRGPQSITIDYTGGYTTATAPADLKRAVIMQAAYEHRAGANLGRESISAGGVSANLAPAALLPEVRAIIMYYKRWSH